MPNLKISQLTELTTPQANDVLAIVDTTVFPIETKKIKFSNLGGSGWKTDGNAGTAAGANFIGTTDAVDFVIKTNNIEKVRVLSNGRVGIGTSAPGKLLDVSADILVNSLTIGRGAGSIATNTATGFQALNSNTTGQYNTAVGYQTLTANTTGLANTAFGDGALQHNITGNLNTAIGSQALNSNISGNNNIALGRNALALNQTGTSNIGIGSDALLNTTGSFNVAIGTVAGSANTIGSNNTYVGYNTGSGVGVTPTTGSNNTIIGANVAGLPAAMSGNIILATGAGIIRLQFDSVGVATFNKNIIGNQMSLSGTAIDWNDAYSYKTLSANTTFTFGNNVDGKSISVKATNTAGNYTVTWPAAVKWSGGTAPTQTVGAFSDIYTFVQINGIIYGSFVQNF